MVVTFCKNVATQHSSRWRELFSIQRRTRVKSFLEYVSQFTCESSCATILKIISIRITSRIRSHRHNARLISQMGFYCVLFQENGGISSEQACFSDDWDDPGKIDEAGRVQGKVLPDLSTALAYGKGGMCRGLDAKVRSEGKCCDEADGRFCFFVVLVRRRGDCWSVVFRV